MPETLDCGHAPTPNLSGIGGTGVAITPDDKRVCYACADEHTRERMRVVSSIVLYLDGSAITTWSGGKMADVTSRVSRRMRLPNGSACTRVFVRATDLDGKRWYGSGPGDAMYIGLRAAKQLPRR